MRRVNLIATVAHTYGGRRLFAGDAFRATPTDARLLKAIKRAVDQTPDHSYLAQQADVRHPEEHPELYRTSDMEAETTETSAEPPKRKRRTYRKREMTADTE